MEIARVMSSDAHSIGAFGRNAQGAKKMTRLKMDSLTFDSFRSPHGLRRSRSA